VQFYIPEYGWLDFEATMFAMPPSGFNDISTWDVAIPFIDENMTLYQVQVFPWQTLFLSLRFLAVLGLVSIYTLRYGRELILFQASKRGGREGARFLYLLLLARLAADGKAIKPASKTALEYAELFPNTDKGFSPFIKFAVIYTELRWREFKNAGEENERFLLLKEEYENILNTTRRKGLCAFLIRIFSLRGLAYL
jgi:hypothetical protein